MTARRLWRMSAVAATAAALGGCGGDDAVAEVAGDASIDADASVHDGGGGSDAGAPETPSEDAESEALVEAGSDGAIADADAHADADGDAIACPPTLCAGSEPASCPVGLCIDSLCYPPVVDPHRWDGCGDGTCDPCEDPLSCPADCGTAPTLVGAPAYEDPNTMTVWVHGFNNNNASSLKTQVYAAARGCGDLGDLAAEYGITRPCGDVSPTAPNQLVGVEYYGGTPPSWMSAADVAEIEQYPYLGGPTGLQRYARVVAKFIRHQMAISGATHVNLSCHSMGCLLSRYVIENDLEHLASERVISRWIGCAGVVGGAQLARLYNNAVIQQTADLIGLAVDDFALMNPDYVAQYAASWDHKLWSADSPLFGGILLHHMGATDPRIPQAVNIQLLDLFNPANAPNDGIMFTGDELFQTTGPLAVTHTPSGVDMPATHSLVYIGHMEAASAPGFHAIAAAGLFHRRKVRVTLTSLTLHNDREFALPDNASEQGASPGEISVETKVRYDPYTQPTFGRSALVQDDEIAYRSPDLFTQTAGTTDTHRVVLFEGPVFDGQTSLQLDATIDEVDQYARFGVNEALLLTPNRPLAAYSGVVTLQDQTLSVSTQYADAEIEVRVVPMY